MTLAGDFGDGIYDAKYDFLTDNTTIRIFHEAPTLVDLPNGITNFSVGSDVVIQFNETVHHGSGGIIEIIRASDDFVVETITTADLDPQNTNNPLVTFDGSRVTINPVHDLEAGKTYYLKITEDFIDNGGQTSYIAGKSGPNSYNLSFSTAGVAPPPSTDSPNSGSSSTVDGVTVTTGTTNNGDGTSSTTVSIPVVTNTRAEQVGNNAVADIPLVSSGGASLLSAQLPTGYGLQASGTATPKAAGSSLTDLIREIKAHTTAGSSDQNQLTGGGSGFLGGLSASTPLLVQTLVPSVAPGSTSAPTSPLVITGTPAAAGGPQTALVIDTRGLPSGSAIQLQNVNFAAVIGAVTVTGGDGSQMVWGDSANQTIILGADDDTLHGGGGDDFVGSKTGNDVLYGDDGNDTVQGGEEHDQLYGNTGTDVLFGNTGADTLFGGQGEDLLHGGRDDDRLSGDLGADTLNGDQGNDVLTGGLSDGSLADASGDQLFGNAGADVLFGNAGADTLHGGQEADTLYGGRDDDRLFGDLGDDVLIGDLGNDTLSGGAGADLFRFSPGSGRDEIADFSAGEGDRIQLAAGQAYNLRSDGAGNAVIVFSSDDEVVLRGIRREDVQTGWFVTG
ncbi:Ig-like domain-containing protein [Azospirillum sp. A1-3]|nr:Ig-like domain-containing protein [Azospirillum sp. A1-3]